MYEYRIEYQIMRSTGEDGDFEEIGFGSSGTWDHIADAEHWMGSGIENREWETTEGQPDPKSVDRFELDGEGGEW